MAKEQREKMIAMERERRRLEKLRALAKVEKRSITYKDPPAPLIRVCGFLK